MMFDEDISDTVLDEGVAKVIDEIDARLAELTPEQQQQFLEGAVYAFDAVQRHAPLGVLTPLDRELFLGSVIANTYSRTYHWNLDPETNMKPLVESEDLGRAQSTVAAAAIHEGMGLAISLEQKMRVKQDCMLLQMKGYDPANVTVNVTYQDKLPENK